VPSLDGGAIAAFAATEASGAHPASIATTLSPDGDGFVLRGKKTWITLAEDADTLLVVASTHRSEKRNHLVVARVAAASCGVALDPMLPTAFVPEIAHAELTLDGVTVAAGDVLPGDGYDAYLKPFRTVEDLHVHGALLGYLVGVARRHAWPAPVIESLLALVASTAALAHCDPCSPAVHLAVTGLLTATRCAMDDAEPHWANVGEEERTRWSRDRPLLQVAQKARSLRTEAAWRAVGAAQAGSETE
jgi:hypothetical protein